MTHERKVYMTHEANLLSLLLLCLLETLKESNVWPQIWLYDFSKHIAFQSTRMNYSNMTVLCRCDALLSEGHKTHQTKHVSTETSRAEGRQWEIAHVFSSNSMLAKFQRIDCLPHVSYPLKKKKNPQTQQACKSNGCRRVSPRHPTPILYRTWVIV